MRTLTGSDLEKVILWVILVFLLAAPAAAQDGPGTGGIIRVDSAGGIPNFNPLICADTGCMSVNTLLFPLLMKTDPVTGELIKGAPGTLATGWEVSADGRVYTISLRRDWNWSDGTPITARDLVYPWEVYSSPEFDVAKGLPFENIEAVDDHTVRVTFKEATCTASNWLTAVTVVPAHVFQTVPFAELADHPFANEPTVTAGPFRFGQVQPGESFSLIADPTYPDAQPGYVVPEALVFQVVPDPTVAVERFLAGELDVLTSIPVSRRSDVRAAAERGDVQIYEFTGAYWDYIGLNLADPKNPEPGLDEKGSPVDQGHHPILGDARVRQAIALALDIDSIIQGAVFGEAERMASNVIPSSWAVDPDLKPIAYDPEAAKKLLVEAGWRDDDGDGIREAHGALYVPDGTPLRFTLLTNDGNERRTAIGTIAQDQLRQVGMDVNFQTIDFNTMLETVDGQTFDAVILGWGFGATADPDLSWIFLPEADVPGWGYNATSYNNPEVTRLMKAGLSVPGCKPEDRAPYYYRIQEIMQADLPYVWLYAQKQMYAASSHLQGFDPWPGDIFHNVDQWAKP